MKINKHGLTIKTNNNQRIQLSFGDDRIRVLHLDSKNEIKRVSSITSDEIVMMINLLDIMDKSVYLIGDKAMKVLKESYAIDDVIEFQIKQ